MTHELGILKEAYNDLRQDIRSKAMTGSTSPLTLSQNSQLITKTTTTQKPIQVAEVATSTEAVIPTVKESRSPEYNSAKTADAMPS